VLLFCQSCEAQSDSRKGVKGNGDYSTEIRTTLKYSYVSLEGVMDIELVAGTEGELSVQAESNFFDYIITEVEGDTLKIYKKGGANLEVSKRMGINITVPFEELDGVFSTASGDIFSSDTIEANSFLARSTGSGDIKLTVDAAKIQVFLADSGDIVLMGNAKELECSTTESGDLDASKLRAEKVSALVSGSGDIDVYASQELKANIKGSGDISFAGNPKKQDFQSTGSGSISAND